MARSQRARTSGRGCLGGAVVMIAALALTVGAVVLALNVLTRSGPSGDCIARLDDSSSTLEGDQAANAALLSAVALSRELPARATTIAIATALQESKLRNIDYGDRDSVGLFQQRPSQGWGTVEQIMDPVYATNAFYDVLVTVEGWEAQEITEAAQNVQRSGFPDAYAQHETRGRAFASALSGFSAGALTCHLPEAEDSEDATTAQRLAFVTNRLTRDYGEIASTVTPEGVLSVDATTIPGGRDPSPQRLGWAVAQWAVATASETGASVVAVDGQVWLRADGDEADWQPLAGAEVPDAVAAAASSAAPGTVIIA